MKKLAALSLLSALLFVIAGCETTSTRPYTSSTKNVVMVQNKIKASYEKIKLGEFKQAENSGSLLCRLNGPVDVSPGKSQAEFIKEAFQTELFLAQVYDPTSDIELSGTLNSIKFSSVSPAYWTLNFTISSNKSAGYTVETVYPFKTSFSAFGACRNVAEAFTPAVQALISEILGNPNFSELVEG
ncbi:hypothetical protein [Microbulbifer sp. 2205BS26-8]|uniref:hypothetical protein n=1 Tax=Microbulbifer sp. 2205BS26-8 TaxID=3064386 RepID=UPI00273E701D|nr:hypothetical protein [Microbulbifer sp. 2205BS26-8]MDP5211160.1 hypothetical protein [Microbulbifer sp. 2205BS26-8]